jgi:hypothetical protein
MRRREFITLPAVALGGAMLESLARESRRLRMVGENVLVPLRFFTGQEAQVMAAACESFRAMPPGPVPLTPAWSYTSIASSPARTAATRIATSRHHSSTPFHSTGIRDAKRLVTLTAPEFAHSVISPA